MVLYHETLNEKLPLLRWATCYSTAAIFLLVHSCENPLKSIRLDEARIANKVKRNEDIHLAFLFYFYRHFFQHHIAAQDSFLHSQSHYPLRRNLVSLSVDVSYPART